MIDLCVKHKVKRVFLLGDIFDSRKAQRQLVLDAFDEILDDFEEADIIVVGIPGNHDKTLYNSHTSFLKPFRHHPAFEYYDNPYTTILGDFKVDLLPFFEEEMYLDQLSIFKQAPQSDFLFTHTAFEGSINNDGSKVSTPIKPKFFEQYKTVFSGHYHNQHVVGKNIVHIPSIQQNNYGEDNQKGFTAIFEDGSYELIVSRFREFKKLKIDLDSLSSKEVDSIINESSFETENSNIRIEFTGDKSKLKSIKKELLVVRGFDVKTKDKSVEKSIELASSGEAVRYNDSSIMEEFNSFCESNSLDVNTGVKYLIKRLEDGKKEDR